MPSNIFDPEFIQCLEDAHIPGVRKVRVGGRQVEIPAPFPSPTDWRDCWIYFLLLDRFNNPEAAPRGPWNQAYGFRQGGTFKAGMQGQVMYYCPTR